MVFSATINNILAISRESDVVEEETGVSGEIHPPAASRWQTLSYKIHLVYPGTVGIEFTLKVIGDYRNETMVH